MDIPKLIVVGGPNGSGKSTFALKHSDATGIRYVGADQIAAELSPNDPVSARIEASRQFIVRIRESIVQGESLVIESTLAGKSLRNLIGDAKNAGYAITMFFVFLDSADSCVVRVKQRVMLGGHDVPELDIRRRFDRSIANFWNIYRELADFWLLVYNSGTKPENVAFGDRVHSIVQIDDLFEKYFSRLKNDD